MRNTYKKVNMVKGSVTVYNRDTKKEEAIPYECAEGFEPSIPENCVELSREETAKREVTMKLTPEAFMAHAIIVEDE